MGHFRKYDSGRPGGRADGLVLLFIQNYLDLIEESRMSFKTPLRTLRRHIEESSLLVHIETRYLAHSFLRGGGLDGPLVCRVGMIVFSKSNICSLDKARLLVYL